VDGKAADPLDPFFRRQLVLPLLADTCPLSRLCRYLVGWHTFRFSLRQHIGLNRWRQFDGYCHWVRLL
jgi:hypothetical protein